MLIGGLFDDVFAVAQYSEGGGIETGQRGDQILRILGTGRFVRGVHSQLCQTDVHRIEGIFWRASSA